MLPETCSNVIAPIIIIIVCREFDPGSCMDATHVGNASWTSSPRAWTNSSGDASWLSGRTGRRSVRIFGCGNCLQWPCRQWRAIWSWQCSSRSRKAGRVLRGIRDILNYSAKTNLQQFLAPMCLGTERGIITALAIVVRGVPMRLSQQIWNRSASARSN